MEMQKAATSTRTADEEAAVSLPTNAAQAARLDFVRCSYTVKNRHKGGPKLKSLLVECSASVKAGEVLAILGPSGAGKTTLLNTLTLEPSGGTPYGVVTLNGNSFTLAMYKRTAAVVQQHDTLWTFMTARDHVMYATRLYQPEHDPHAYADSMLKEMGLVECQHVIAGNILLRGLSGGQKRRLSLAVALTKEPSVVFLDEPTSGLDAAAAASIMAFLRETAPRVNTALVCTIHQPSTSVFAGFDKVCFLTGGKICYLGPAAELETYLASVGNPVPLHSNPADFMLDLTNRDFVDGATVDHMVSSWAARAEAVVAAEPTPVSLSPPPSKVAQLSVLLSRHSRLMFFDPTIYLGRVGANLVSTCFFALIYVRTRDAVQEQIFNRFFFTFWLVVLPCAPAASLWAVAHNGASHRASRLPPPPSSRLALSWLVLTLTSPLVR